jgi:NADP-dependent 3-hydroxy acid dehydrogenase YdfG
MNRIDLGGRIAIVTGAARGIGHAIAERFSASGAKVAIWDLDGAAAEAASLGIENAICDVVDVTDPAGIARALHKRPRPGSERRTFWSTMPEFPDQTCHFPNIHPTNGGGSSKSI